MKKRGLTSSCLSFVWIAAFLACDDDGTGPDNRLKLSPGQAEPFALVEIVDLPDTYSGIDISVGGTLSMLIFDPADKVHRFVVPNLAPGRVDVVLPATPESEERKATLQVVPRKYVGGTPESALNEMDVLLDSMQVSLSLGLAVVDTKADSAIYGRFEAFLTLAEALQDHVKTLSSQDRAVIAGIFSAMAPDLRALSGDIAGGISELRAQPPILSGGTGAVTSPVSASLIVGRCVDHSATMDRLERLADIMGYVASVANALSWFAGPAIRAAVGVFTTVATMAIDLTVIIINSVPALIDPEGLRLQVSPARLKHDGGQGAMSVWVRRRAGGEILGSSIGIVMGMAGVRSAIRDYESTRKLVNWEALGGAIVSVLKDLGVLAALQYLDEKTRDLIADHILPGGEVQSTFDGVSFTAGHPASRWEFTGAATAPNRAIRTIGQNQQAVESFPVSARIGSVTRCMAATGSANPANGINGFEIASTARIRFVSATGSTLDMNAGSSASASVGVTNEGAQGSGALTYRLQDPNGGAYSPPSWLTVGPPSGPSGLSAGTQGTVRFSVSLAGDAPQKQLVIPVSVLEDGKVVDNAWVQVRVLPQLSDIVVNRSPSTLRLWDHGQQDGDIVTVTLNGAPVVSALSLTNAGVSLPMEYRRGRNVLVVRAHNEGSISPNTAALGFANVVQGSATQTYDLSTNASTQLVITFDPAATQTAASQHTPAPSYTRCAAGLERDCRP